MLICNIYLDLDLHVYTCVTNAMHVKCRVVDHLRGTRLNSEFIFCSVCSVSTFSAVLDSLEHADSGKNCPVKLLNVCLEMSGVLSGG